MRVPRGASQAVRDRVEKVVAVTLQQRAHRAERCLVRGACSGLGLGLGLGLVGGLGLGLGARLGLGSCAAPRQRRQRVSSAAEESRVVSSPRCSSIGKSARRIATWQGQG